VTQIDNTVKLLAAEATLGLGDAKSLASTAVELLTAGLDSPTIVAMASLSESETNEARSMRDRALSEMGVALPGVREAAKSLALEVARKVTEGCLPPYDGAKRIWDLTLRIHPERIHDLDPFVYAASEWEDRPADRAFFENAILREARAFLDG
jgi:hypothetical protein